MTGNKALLKNYSTHMGGFVSFGNNEKGKVMGSGTVSNGKIQFQEVNHVDNLKFNLLSVSQMCDKGYGAIFSKNSCKIVTPELHQQIEQLIANNTLLEARRQGNVYVVDLAHDTSVMTPTCFLAKASSSETNLWHRRLGHVNLKTINKLSKLNLVRGLPQKEFQCEEHCVPCLKGKQTKVSHKTIDESKSNNCLQLLHLDLFGPIRFPSLASKRYCLVIVDDFSRFTWCYFLQTKDEAANYIKDFIVQVERQFELQVKTLRSDNGTEFRNENLDSFCINKGIMRQFSIPRTPQQNGVVERKNKTLIEAARSMLADSGLPLTFWAEAVNTACYIQNRVLVNKRHAKTSYEILHGFKPLISFFRSFGCVCFILNLKDSISKFAAKVDSGYFIGYSSTSKAYRVFNSRTKVVEETLNMKFNEVSSEQIPADPKGLFDLEALVY